jgi:hypothetical protein
VLADILRDMPRRAPTGREGLATRCGWLIEEFVPDELVRREGSVEVPQWLFARRLDSGPESLPVLTRMLRARRQGAEVRVRLLMWLLALSRGGTNTPFKMPTAGDLAVVVDLPRTPGGQATSTAQRRIFGALASLFDEGVLMHPGTAKRRQMAFQDPRAPGRIWEPRTRTQWEEHGRKRQRHDDRSSAGKAEYDFWLWETGPTCVPYQAFSRGHISRMSAPALVVLLALLDPVHRSDDPGSNVVRIAKQRASRYGFSYDTWRDGTSELAEKRIISIRDRQGPGVPRPTYELHLERFVKPVPNDRPVKPQPRRLKSRHPFEPEAPQERRLDEGPSRRCADCGRFRKLSDGAFYRDRYNHGRWWCDACAGLVDALPAPTTGRRLPPVQHEF